MAPQKSRTSLRELARAIGVSERAVRKAKAAGVFSAAALGPVRRGVPTEVNLHIALADWLYSGRALRSVAAVQTSALVQHVAADEYVFLLASNRSALMRACPEHSARILQKVPDASAGRPVWIVHYGDDIVIVAQTEMVVADPPQWWRDLWNLERNERHA